MPLDSIFAPELMRGKRILAIQPHYDDNDLGAGGTLALLRDHGAELYYLTVTDDLIGVVDTNLSAEEASLRLRHEQFAAGEIIGVKEQRWLGYPDAGDYNYFEMRRGIITVIRTLHPHILFTCDPWLPYEAHHDHISTGLAVSEASYLQSMLRFKCAQEVDEAYFPYDISAVVFYFTHAPNTTIDISQVHERKAAAIACYQTQFTLAGMIQLINDVETAERKAGGLVGAKFAEQLKVLSPSQLHTNLKTEQ